MTQLSFSRRVAAPAPRIFAAMTDLDRMPERIDGILGIEKLTDGPVGPGTRFRETRVMFRRPATEELEFTAVEPDRFHRIECASCGAHFGTEFTLTPDGDATDVGVVVRITPQSFMAKLMRPVSGLMARTVRKCIERDLASIERSLAAEDGRHDGSPLSEDAR